MLVAQQVAITNQVVNYPTWNLTGGTGQNYFAGFTATTFSSPKPAGTNDYFSRQMCIYIPAGTACQLSVTDNGSPPTGTCVSQLSVVLLDASIFTELTKSVKNDGVQLSLDVLTKKYDELLLLVGRLARKRDDDETSDRPPKKLRLSSPEFIEEEDRITTRKR